MSNILEELKRYFQDTSQEKILSDWAELEKYDRVEPTVQEFKKVSQYFFKYDNYILSENWKKCNILANPKFNLRVSF